MLKHVHVGWGPVSLYPQKPKHPSLKLNTNRLTLELDSTAVLVIESEYEETPEWKSSNEKVALVDQNGGVTIVGYGTAVITVTSGKSKGTCIITVPKPQEKPEEPEEPTTKLDKTKIYYGVVQNQLLTNFSELTEEDIINSTSNGNIQTVNLGVVDGATLNVLEMGDLVVVLIPSNKYKATVVEIDGSEHSFIDSATGTDFHCNGEIKLGDFYIYGNWAFSPGQMKINVK